MKRHSTSLLAIKECKSQKNEVHLIPNRMAITRKKKKDIIMIAGQDLEKLGPSYTAGENVKWYRHFGKQYDSSSKY